MTHGLLLEIGLHGGRYDPQPVTRAPTQARRCEQVAQICYLVAHSPGVKLATSPSRIQRPNHIAIKTKKWSFFVDSLSSRAEELFTLVWTGCIMSTLLRFLNDATLIENLIVKILLVKIVQWLSVWLVVNLHGCNWVSCDDVQHVYNWEAAAASVEERFAFHGNRPSAGRWQTQCPHESSDSQSNHYQVWCGFCHAHSATFSLC